MTMLRLTPPVISSRYVHQAWRFGATTIIGNKRSLTVFSQASSSACASAIALFLGASLNRMSGVRALTLHDQEV